MANYKISKNMLDIQWSFVSLVIPSCAHVLLRIILGKELGPSGLGSYTLIFTIYMIGTQFVAFGLDIALTKYIAEYKDNLQKIKDFVSAGIIGALICGLALSSILYVLSEIISINIFHNSSMSELLKIISMCFPFLAVQKVVLGTLNGLRKLKYYALINIIQNVLILIVSTVAVVYLNGGIKGAIFGLITPTIFTAVISSVSLKRYSEHPKTMNVHILKELFKFGFFVILTNSIGMINTQIDSLFIGHFMTEVDVGYYAVAVIFMQITTLLPTAVQTITYPLIASYHHNNEYNNIKVLIKNTLVKTYFATIITSVFIILCGKLLIRILFTEDFIPAYIPMLILLIGYSISAPIGAVGGALAGIGKVKSSFQRSVLCMLINIVLAFLLIPKFGLIGAACSTSLSLIFTLITHTFLLNKYIFRKEESELRLHKTITH